MGLGPCKSQLGPRGPDKWALRSRALPGRGILGSLRLGCFVSLVSLSHGGLPFLVSRTPPPPRHLRSPPHRSSHDAAGAFQVMPVVVVVVVAVMRGDGGGLKGARGRQGRGAAVAGRWRRVAVILLALAYAASMLVVFLGGGAGGVAVAGALRQRGAPAPAGSVYRSHLVLDRLLPEMRASSASRPHPLMTPQNKKSGKRWAPCITKKLRRSELPPSNGFLIIEANGGLNQQRISICDAVAVASLLNATLVTPAFHLNSVWRDSSKFGDIFDEDHFIGSLRKYIRVVKELPEDAFVNFDHNISMIPNMRTKAFSSESYYLQKALRCFANYEALRFSEPIRMLGTNMVDRMIKMSSLTGGKYISVHLRFEEDMLAFSCCIYDGGWRESIEMENARERSWRGKFHRPGRVINPEANRRNGKCPLTPLEVGKFAPAAMLLSMFLLLACSLLVFSCHASQAIICWAIQLHPGESEGCAFMQNNIPQAIPSLAQYAVLDVIYVGMMLKGMGFDNTTSLYVASGKIYNAEKYMTPLRQLFPLLQTKDTLASPEELAQFKTGSTGLHGLSAERRVCDDSRKQLSSFSDRHRRYLYGGNAKTIKPDKRKLVALFDNPNIRWDRFKRQMQDIHRHSESKGFGVRKPNGSISIYTLPMPDCMCQRAEP
uniref:O-fucosyltransferase family protein n=1 Tax=Oryza glumipatula TaxID=40148 RepID=A0A0E0BFZ7_9ORYZ